MTTSPPPLLPPAEALTELDACRARSIELRRQAGTTPRAEAERLRELAALCRRELGAWDALDIQAAAQGDPAVIGLLSRGAAAAAVQAIEAAAEWDSIAELAEQGVRA